MGTAATVAVAVVAKGRNSWGEGGLDRGRQATSERWIKWYTLGERVNNETKVKLTVMRTNGNSLKLESYTWRGRERDGEKIKDM